MGSTLMLALMRSSGIYWRIGASESLSQLLTAYHGNAPLPLMRGVVGFSFLSFLFLYHIERTKPSQCQWVSTLRLMGMNPNLDIDFHDSSIREPIDSESSAYIKKTLREKIARASVVACLIGNRTAWRDWVEWELQTAQEMHKGLCGIRLKGAYGQAPQLLRDIGAPVAKWDHGEMVAVIESAAARRS